MDLSKYPESYVLGRSGNFILYRDTRANEGACDIAGCFGSKVVSIGSPQYAETSVSTQICGECFESLINSIPLEMVLMREDMKDSADTIRKIVHEEYIIDDDGAIRDLGGTTVHLEKLILPELKAIAHAFKLTDYEDIGKKADLVDYMQKNLTKLHKQHGSVEGLKKEYA